MKVNTLSRMRASEINAMKWINTPEPIKLKSLRGKVVVIHAFQIFCPACVLQGIPQTNAIFEMYSSNDVQVIGLHSVFEHHDVMSVDALLAYIHEFRLKFPIAVDMPSKISAIPLSMQQFELKGTPSLILIDKKGYIRLNHFGQLSDMQVGNLIGQLINEE